MNMALTQIPSPNPWKMGMMASMASASLNWPQAATCMPSLIRLRLESMMPLGVPVVPPLYKMTAISPDCMDDGGN